MTSAPLRTLVLSAVLLTAAVAPNVQARPVDCGGTGVAKCVIATERATERVQSGPHVFSSGTHAPNLRSPAAPSVQTKLTGWAPSFAAPETPPAPGAAVADESAASLSWDAAPGGDRPYLALLLATVGIVAFMAHRRSGS